MRVAVTGGAGFIGSHVAGLLVDAGHEVHVVDDLRGGRNAVPGARLHAVAVSRWDPPARLGAVVHLAGPVGPVGVLSEAGRIVPAVVSDALAVAGWALRAGCPLVYASTSEIYGPQGGACSESLPRVTVAGHSARMEYAVAKLAAETMLLNTGGLDARVVRPFNVAGPRQRPEGGFVIPRFARQALAGEPLTVYAPGTQLRAFTHVSDVAAGIVAMLDRGEPGLVCNLGNPDNLTTVADLARLVLERSGSASRVLVVDPADLWGPGFREAADKWPDASLAEARLGWRARLPLSRIVDDALAELRP